jgi:hypothetical protein
MRVVAVQKLAAQMQKEKTTTRMHMETRQTNEKALKMSITLQN